ncbi:pyridoxal phosphate-dependent transferase [Syncephalis fuscata]|nr:pyridoxal phosphate-dependent transferase [Syncephalis fuscata]
MPVDCSGASKSDATPASSVDTLPLAKDFSSYYSRNARELQPSPLKGLLKYMAIPGLISLGAGLPHPATFPFAQVSIDMKNHTVINEPIPSTSLTVASSSSLTDLSSNALPTLNTALQYGAGRGLVSLRSFFTEETRRLHLPRYADWDVVATAGNTDAFSKVASLFLNAGDGILVEKWCYPAIMETVKHMNVTAWPVDMDDDGMRPDSLRQAVASWTGDRPLNTVYVIPTGQNPTSTCMSLERRQAIYAVAQELNLIIIEDDPYYHLQFNESPDAPLLPSLLSMDTDGRVIRLESFSKILAPGMRLGWLVAPQAITHLIQYHNEISIQQPSGWSQAIAAHLLLDTWGQSGWQRHLAAIRENYRQKCDYVQQICERELTGLCEWKKPKAGMFFWFRLNLPESFRKTPGHMEQVFERCIEHGVLLVPGWQFIVTKDSKNLTNTEKADQAPYLRAGFSYETSEKVEEAIIRLGKVLTSLGCGTA